MFPLPRILKNWVVVELKEINGEVSGVAEADTEKRADGVEVGPTPIFPLVLTENMNCPVEEAIASGLAVEVPSTVSVAVGVVEPIPTLPFWRIERIVAPVEDAMKRGLVPAAPLMLKVTVDDVALIPETVPLSKMTPDVNVLADAQTAARPWLPPVRVAESPRVEVEIH